MYALLDTWDWVNSQQGSFLPTCAVCLNIPKINYSGSDTWTSKHQILSRVEPNSCTCPAKSLWWCSYVCVCLGLITWDWITYHRVCCWRRMTLPLSTAIKCLSFIIQGWDFVRFPHQVDTTGVAIVWVLLRSLIAIFFMGVASLLYKGDLSPSRYPGPLALTPPAFLWPSLSPWCLLQYKCNIWL